MQEPLIFLLDIASSVIGGGLSGGKSYYPRAGKKPREKVTPRVNTLHYTHWFRKARNSISLQQPDSRGRGWRVWGLWVLIFWLSTAFLSFSKSCVFDSEFVLLSSSFLKPTGQQRRNIFLADLSERWIKEARQARESYAIHFSYSGPREIRIRFTCRLSGFA